MELSKVYTKMYIQPGSAHMNAKIFKSGNSQAVRIPKEFRFDVNEVEIFKRGEELVLRPKAKNLGVVFDLLSEMPDDFMVDGREDDRPQEREGL
jgi:antitoxin VapB